MPGIPQPPGRLTRTLLSRAAKALAQRDTDLERVFRHYGAPPLWARPGGFKTLVHIILEQQVSLASARATLKRLSEAITPLSPQNMVETGEQGLRRLGVTRQKSAYCVGLARALCSGQLDLRLLSRLDDRQVADTLTRIKGVGPWTANIYLLMALRRPDIWPAHDLALTTAVWKLKGFHNRPTQEELLRVAEGWRPYRSVAARMLWQYYLAGMPDLSRPS